MSCGEGGLHRIDDALHVREAEEARPLAIDRVADQHQRRMFGVVGRVGAVGAQHVLDGQVIVTDSHCVQCIQPHAPDLVGPALDDRLEQRFLRRSVEQHGGDIVFAALSLDDDGLASYGDVSVVLSVPLVKKRISVFEKNSFVLYDELTREKGWEPVDFPPPTGHFGIWESRHQLAVAKCHTQLDGNEKDEDFCPILLHSTNDQSKDEFIELHIFDKITYFNFQKVKFQAKLTDKQSLIALSIAKEKLEEAGIEIEIV